jgi:hypothetical protein
MFSQSEIELIKNLIYHAEQTDYFNPDYLDNDGETLEFTKLEEPIMAELKKKLGIDTE